MAHVAARIDRRRLTFGDRRAGLTQSEVDELGQAAIRRASKHLDDGLEEDGLLVRPVGRVAVRPGEGQAEVSSLGDQSRVRQPESTCRPPLDCARLLVAERTNAGEQARGSFSERTSTTSSA
jgi:hypothetical protein